MSNFNFTIDMPVHNTWDNVDLVRLSIQNCLAIVFKDMDCCRALAMVTGELLENAIKYGDWESKGAAFRLRVWGAEERVFVEVENPVSAKDADSSALFETLAWMDTYPSPQEAYIARLIEIAGREEHNVSQLGLVRIAYEGNCRLTAERADGALRVTAEMQV